MSYSATNWVDGVTPVDASNLNKLEGGVADVASQLDDLISENPVACNQSGVRIECDVVTTSNPTKEITASLFGIVFCMTDSSNYAIYFWRSGYRATMATAGSYITASVSGTTLTINNGASVQVRYIAIIN